MRYVVRNSITGFLLSFLVAYFIRLWALDHGHNLLATLATVYMFVLLFPIIVVLAILVFVLLFLLGSGSSKKINWRPFWFKNRTWTR